MSNWCEFGNVDSDREIVIHVANVLAVVPRREEITFGWLADRVRMPLGEVWEALDLPNNAPFVEALYTAKAAEWGYEIEPPQQPGRTAPATPFVEGPQPAKLPMPRVAPPHLEALHWLDVVQSNHEWCLDWALPPVDLWLPKRIETMTYSPAIEGEQGARRRKCISVGVGEPYVALPELRAANLRLQGAIEASEQRIQKELARIACIQKMLGLVELQIRHWRHPWNPLEPPTKDEWEVRHEQIDRLVALDVALKQLLRQTVATLEDSADQDSAADDLLAMLAPSGPLGSQLAAFFDQLERRHTTVSAPLLDDVVKALCDSFALLSRSSRAETFLRDHLLTVLEGFCENLPDGLEAVILDLEDERLRLALTDRWRDFFVMTRRLVGARSDSPLAVLGRMGKVYRTLVKVPTAALHDAFLSRFLTLLHRTHDPEWRALSSTAAFLLRFVSSHGVQHRGSSATLSAARATRLDDLLSEVVADRLVAPEDWQKRGRVLNEEFQLKNGYAYKPTTATLGLLISVAALCYAAQDEKTPPHVYGLNMVAGLADSGSAMAGAAGTLARRLGRGDLGLYKVASAFSGIGSAVGMLGAFFSAYEDRVRGNTYRMWTNVISGAGSAFSGAAWGLTLFTGSSTLTLAAGCCTGIGVVLAAVALSLTLLESELRAGTDQMLDVYWAQIDARTSPAKRCPDALRTAEETLRMARAAGAFTPWNMSVGKERDPFAEGPPSFVLAHAIGFECQEIECLFNVRQATVTAHTSIRPVDYSKVVP